MGKLIEADDVVRFVYEKHQEAMEQYLLTKNAVDAGKCLALQDVVSALEQGLGTTP